MTNYTISVVIPLYNHEKYIADCIHSILKQSYPPYEIIIINDGSSDDSGKIVQAIKDPRIKYRYQTNQGAARTINQGIRLCQGQFIAILNSDDCYHPERFRAFIEVFERQKNLKALFSNLEYIDENGAFIKNKDGLADNYVQLLPGDYSFQGDSDLLLHLLSGNFFATTSNLFCTREVFAELGYFSPLQFTHDYDFFLRLCYRYRGEIHYAPQTLLQYRYHGQNTLKADHRLFYYELAVMYAKFFKTANLNRLFGDHANRLETMAKFLNSFNRFNLLNHSLDKIVLTALLFGEEFKEQELYDVLLGDRGNPFRGEALKRIAREEHENIDDYLKHQQHFLLLDKILHSKAFRVYSLIREAQRDKSQWLLFPFRLMRFLKHSD
ncbi:MAG: glycosyltransferase [Deltaproteobacteria bacterium]|nr:glycosyltransferase [Deltaproteobacteria bacterium]